MPAGERMGEPFPNGYSDRMQSIVTKQQEGWKAGPATPAPFAHSGFPEVLMTTGRRDPAPGDRRHLRDNRRGEDLDPAADPRHQVLPSRGATP